MKNQKNKSVNGITLIALVVTIVVLLILAGVSLNALFGNNGIIQKAQDAQNKMDEATQNDLDAINGLNEWIDGESTGGDTGEALDIIERYVLGEEKNGISLTTIFNLETFTFINNEIISDAETSLQFIDFIAIKEKEAELLFEYNKKVYVITITEIGENTYSTKTVKVKQYTYTKKIFDGSIKLEPDRTEFEIPEKLTLTKTYKIVYTEDEKILESITGAGTWGGFGTLALRVSDKFVINTDMNFIDLTLNSQGKNLEIKQIYEIGESESFVEENEFMAYLSNGSWGIMNTPGGSYTVPTTVNGKKITRVYLDYMFGDVTFTQPFKMDEFLVDPIAQIQKIKVTTSDVNFIFDMQDYEHSELKEIDLSECGDNMEIPTDFANAYSDVTIYVSQAVKTKYPSVENIKVKE